MENHSPLQTGPKLSDDRVEFYKGKMVDNGVPVRFMYKGQNLRTTTGELLQKGVNVIHQYVYWCFDKKTAQDIAGELGEGVKVSFS